MIAAVSGRSELRRIEMAVLMTAHIEGGTQEMIDGLRPLLEKLKQASGFVVHTNGPVPGGWRVIEVWESKSEFEAWYEGNVKPAFPEGARLPLITFDELNEVALR
jgi:quinol monooxygenase YgiN